MAVELAAIVRGELFGSSRDRHARTIDLDRDLQPATTIRRGGYRARAAPMQAFEYDLPAACIAQVPAEPRDSARPARRPRRRRCAPDHRLVADLPDLLEPGDVLVVNDTRVIPARLRVRRDTGGNVEVFLVRPSRRRADGMRSCGRRGASASARCCARCIPRETSSRSRSVSGWTTPVACASGCSRTTRSTRSIGTARCRCRRTSTRRSTIPSGTRRCTPRRPGSVAAPTAGSAPHAGRSCSDAGPSASRSARSSSSSASTRSGPSSPIAPRIT